MSRVGSAAADDDVRDDAANDDASRPSDAAAAMEVEVGASEGDKSRLIRAM
jgi:hypothetical protein